MHLLRILVVLFLVATYAQAQSPVARSYTEVAETAEWTFYVDTRSIKNDSFYCQFSMLAQHKLYGTQVPFYVEIQKRQNRYKTRDADKLSFHSLYYVPIPAGSVLEAAYQFANESGR